MENLVDDISNDKNIVLVTGGGLAAQNQYLPFRAQLESTSWEGIEAMHLKRSMFDTDPLKWWNTFWMRTYALNEMENRNDAGVAPNIAYNCIDNLMRNFANVTLITENIDSLHAQLAGRTHDKHPIAVE